MSGNVLSIINIIGDYIWIPIIPLIIWVVKTKPYVKEVKKNVGPEAEEFKKLYNDRVKDNLKICAEEILHFINMRSKREIEHHLYVCKKFNKTIGFIKFMYSEYFRYIFIAYAAIDNEDKVANKYGATLMLKKINKKYFNTNKAYVLLTEIERPQNGGYLNGMIKLISRYAKKNNKRAYICDFEYFQLAMPDDDFFCSNEELLTLVYIPKNIMECDRISKDDLIRIIHFIYFEIYYPSCKNIKPQGYENYESYIDDIIQMYRETLPDYIKLILID